MTSDAVEAEGARRLLAVKILYATTISAIVYLRVHPVVYPFLLPVILAAAYRWGDWEERLCVSGLVITLEVLTIGPHYGLFPHSFDVDGSRRGVTMVSAAYLALLLVVACRSRKWWPSWAAAFQLLLVLSHPLFVWLRHRIDPWAYASGIQIWSWLELIAMSFGIFDAWVAKRGGRVGQIHPYRAARPTEGRP